MRGKDAGQLALSRVTPFTLCGLAQQGYSLFALCQAAQAAQSSSLVPQLPINPVRIDTASGQHYSWKRACLHWGQRNHAWLPF
jgi:hypothetical protein